MESFSRTCRQPDTGYSPSGRNLVEGDLHGNEPSLLKVLPCFQKILGNLIYLKLPNTLNQLRQLWSRQCLYFFENLLGSHGCFLL